MATKNLSKTAIAGGRCGHYKAEVCDRKSQERAAARHYLKSLETSPDAWDDDPAPIRKPVQPCFRDKLNPVFQFLSASVGRNWNSVRSELFQKFDIRTTPGRHVLFDHLLKSVCQDPGAPKDAPHRRFASYFVDSQGKLQKVESKPRNHSSYWADHANLHNVATWLAGRKLGQAGRRYYWFESTGPRVATCVDRAEIVYVLADDRGDPIRVPRVEDPASGRTVGLGPQGALRPAGGVGFRQGKRLTNEEVEYFSRLPGSVREMILSAAPARWSFRPG